MVPSAAAKKNFWGCAGAATHAGKDVAELRFSCRFIVAGESFPCYNKPVTMELLQYRGGALECNGYLIIGADGGAVAVDAPGGFGEWLARRLPAGVRLLHLLLTHQHFDHIEAAADLQRTTGCMIHAAAAYDVSLTLADQARLWGIEQSRPFTVGDVLSEHDTTLNLAGIEWRALHVPGHSPDSIAWYVPRYGELFSGDALFAGSVGRSDFPGGSARQLTESLRHKILTLPPETHVNPGHGPTTEIGEEIRSNPFCRGLKKERHHDI